METFDVPLTGTLEGLAEIFPQFGADVGVGVGDAGGQDAAINVACWLWTPVVVVTHHSMVLP